MTELRAALQDALGPLYRVEREVRPVGDCRLFVALERPSGPELLVKVLPGQLSLAVDSGVFEREVLLLAPRLGHPGLVTPKGAGRAGSFAYPGRRTGRGGGRQRGVVRGAVPGPRAPPAGRGGQRERWEPAGPARRHVRRGGARPRDADGEAARPRGGVPRGSAHRAAVAGRAG